MPADAPRGQAGDELHKEYCRVGHSETKRIETKDRDDFLPGAADRALFAFSLKSLRIETTRSSDNEAAAQTHQARLQLFHSIHNRSRSAA